MTEETRGRKPKYNQKYQKKAEKYLSTCIPAYETLERPLVITTKDEKTGKVEQVVTTEKYVKRVLNLPSKEGLALYLGVHRDTVYDWTQKYPLFSDIFDKVGAEQARILMEGSLTGELDRVISKVMLTKHGYRDGVDHTTNEKDLPTTNVIQLPDEQYEQALTAAAKRRSSN